MLCLTIPPSTSLPPTGQLLKFDVLRALLDDKKPDILVLTET